MNIRKIAKWYGLKWSNRLEQLLPRFEKDLLVLSNRTINNSQVAFDDKIHALDNIRVEFENPKYYEGLFRVYANFQLFSRMTDSLKEMTKKDLPISETMRDIIQEYALVRPINPENEEAAKELVLTLKNLTELPVPLATETGDKNITLEAYIKMFKPKDFEDWKKLTGFLAVSEQYNVLVQAYRYMQKYNIPVVSEVLDRTLRALVILERPDEALEVVETAFKLNKRLESVQLLELAKQLSLSKKRKLASLIDIKAYRNPSSRFMQFTVKHQELSDIRESETFIAIKQKETAPNVTTSKNYTILLEALASKNDIKAVKELWEEMASKRLLPPVDAYHHLMEAYCSAGDNQSVINVWNSAYGKLPTRSGHLITTLLKSCFMNGSLEDLKDQWEKLKMYDYRLGLAAYRTYIEGLIHFGQYDEAVEVFTKDLCQYVILKPDIGFRDNLVEMLESTEMPTEKRSELLTRANDAFMNFRKTKLAPKFQ
ncbi:hypothetical protein DSO57_1029001 [Entomophthora muscae]|uniref:Uncharacterized protein n=1 Tax=Entomophthora muscae TaxID=34485 RepID=A0ACC2SQP4_9FUNG|nr:hypothetical protein DSO57_1029001 [Entomophthora muscae]